MSDIPKLDLLFLMLVIAVFVCGPIVIWDIRRLRRRTRERMEHGCSEDSGEGGYTKVPEV